MKIFDNIFSVAICSQHEGTNRETGDRFFIAWTKSVAATVVALAEVRFGTS